jgi:hypothetical protein
LLLQARYTKNQRERAGWEANFKELVKMTDLAQARKEILVEVIGTAGFKTQ